MRLSEIFEASGHIPTNSKEANDPRWSNAITVDIKPGEDERQAAKLGFKVKAGRPPKLDPSGKISESVVDAALQVRDPVSAGSRGLAGGRFKFKDQVGDSSNIHKGAVDALANELNHPNVKSEDMITITARHFKMTEEELVRAFFDSKGVRPAEYHKRCMQKNDSIPMRI